jgi:hypothetical protein
VTRRHILLLGHASVQTTEQYLGTKQDLVNAPNDETKLRVRGLEKCLAEKIPFGSR